MLAAAEDCRLFVFGQLVSRYGLDKLKEQLKDGMLGDCWIDDLMGFNPETVRNAINHLHELSNPDWPPTSASFKKICIRHLVGFPSVEESLIDAINAKWDESGIVYAIKKRCGGSWFLDRANDETLRPHWRKAYVEIRDEWLAGSRWDTSESGVMALEKVKVQEPCKSPFKRLEGESVLAMMNRYQSVSRAYSSELPNTEQMLSRLVAENFLESEKQTEFNRLKGRKDQALPVFADMVRMYYIAAYHSNGEDHHVV